MTHASLASLRLPGLSLAIALLALGGCYGVDEAADGASDSDDDDDDGDDGDNDDDDDDVPGSNAAVTCGSAPDRIDPEAVRSMSNADLHALGLARTGANGPTTAHRGATERFVSAANGDDANDGSESSPWRTLQHAADTVEPGTTVLVDASGDYAAFEIHRGGQADAWLTFIAADRQAMPRIVGTASTTAVVDIDASFVVLEGFEVTNHGAGVVSEDAIGIQVEPRGGDIANIELRNNVVHAIGPGQVDEDTCYYNAHGIIAQSEGHLIGNLIIEGNEIFETYVGNSEVLVVNGNVADFCVTANYIHDVNNIAIDVIGYEKNDTETARRGVIADNIVLDASNYWPYCSRGNCTYPYGDESSDGIYVDGGAELFIGYNVVGRTDHGIELQSENGQLIRDVEVAYNAVFNSNYKDLTIGESERIDEHDNVLFSEPGLADEELESCK